MEVKENWREEGRKEWGKRGRLSYHLDILRVSHTPKTVVIPRATIGGGVDSHDPRPGAPSDNALHGTGDRVVVGGGRSNKEQEKEKHDVDQ